MKVKKSLLKKIVLSFKNLSPWIWADFVVDHYIYGTPKRISREAPVLILHQEKTWRVPGGGANTLSNMVALGAQPIPVGYLGDDEAGHFLRDTFSRWGLKLDYLRISKEHATLVKTRILAGPLHGAKQQVVRIDQEKPFPPLPFPSAVFPSKGTLIISDYGYGTVHPESGFPELRKQAIVDSRYQLENFKGAKAATPNEEEGEALLEHETEGEPLEKKARFLKDKLKLEILLWTRGSSGMVVVTDQDYQALPVVGNQQPVDVTGAGDTVLATFSLALQAGADPVDAAFLANIAAGKVVMKLGTQPCSNEELLQGIEEYVR